MDCGPTCLRMIAKFHGVSVSLSRLRTLSQTTRVGSNLQNIASAAEKIGFRTLGVKISYRDLLEKVNLPCIVFWNNRHYVVLYKITAGSAFIADPGIGKLKKSKREFISSWTGEQGSEFSEEGIVLLLEPTANFHKTGDDAEKSRGLAFLYTYLKGYRRYLVQLIFGLSGISLLQLVLPFLTQSVVDIGIRNRDIHFLYLMLIAQIFVFLGRSAIEIVRGWVILHMSTRVNIALVSDFLIKLMKLPISYFDVKLTGDILQRVNDHSRIEELLTSQTLEVLFSALNFLVFSIVLGIYSMPVLGIFLTGTALYFAWVKFFMKRRKELDQSRFRWSSHERSKLIELVVGMPEIKLNNAERRKRWGWEFIQARLFHVQVKSLRLEQLQSNGAAIINESKNILLTFYAAFLVIQGDLTLGMMLSLSYIIGQLNAPIGQFIHFALSVQDAKISLERLAEIHDREDEEKQGTDYAVAIAPKAALELRQVRFTYSGSDQEILKGIDLTIERNKITAIVGTSGSGKTTLMKLLLRFYEPSQGTISIGTTPLKKVSQETWRSASGSVLQEGYIFSDTIANNIALSEDEPHLDKIEKSLRIANIHEFVSSRPLGLNTKIGIEGEGISGGQKQRILIARAVYKDPDFIFFDEATSALDANNERTIMENLNEFLKGRTSVIIAHRLSTVKNADKIVVLENGEIVEEGTHTELLDLKGSYHNLVKNQLELERLAQQSA